MVKTQSHRISQCPAGTDTCDVPLCSLFDFEPEPHRCVYEASQKQKSFWHPQEVMASSFLIGMEQARTKLTKLRRTVRWDNSGKYVRLAIFNVNCNLKLT